MNNNKVIEQVTRRLLARSQASRSRYLAKTEAQATQGKTRSHLSCGNLAHTVAACPSGQKDTILDFTRVNVGIITAYNDMLSAHQPYGTYPDTIKKTLAELGHSAQIAGGVPAMCDGVTQGQDGMDLSLFSRDLIAQATAVSLSHNTFDAALLLGICDKIAPGQLIGALSFGHLPSAFVPSGPMSAGISNDEKVKVRQQYAAGEVGKAALQDMECEAYHSPGTCTFYGTANTNQLVFEAMGLMLPGSSFVAPNDPLRSALTEKITAHIVTQADNGTQYRPLSRVVDEKSIVNGLVALLASGGSTNHSIHLVAVAAAAGYVLTWDDIEALSQAVPLLAKMYPNGPADINEFQQAGGVPALMKALAERGLLNMDATPVYGRMEDYLSTPRLRNGELVFEPVADSSNPNVISLPGTQFSEQGGLKVLDGNLGRGVIKVSAVAPEYRFIEAPARVFESQHDVEKAYHAGEFTKDVVIVVRHNGPAANGMPELHKLMPVMGNLMKSGLRVALVTDGRLSGASGKVPAVIHLSPEAQRGGPLCRIHDGDVIRVDAEAGRIDVQTDLSVRPETHPDLAPEHLGSGRELFSVFRQVVSSAEQGASIFNF
ncbi:MULTISPECIES: phosphogluconate dehydratase [Lonsdalea]|uniref:Phosphogluconate dehydratase n=2 Tax=Lonsdalea TaxID=1082702 RepID=A0ACD1JEB5_9GAMM|nr:MULTISPECIES: phosphogluconate dehydratase [Lonsdalea]RAT14933.1 phosphogluconate dehydratase [Lonsdalea quercina]RAT19419.1 phosphogluconate dehydratase [Lonsdalea populi]RAT26256.1 phosphogluconate dehydratase [Lonsdalea populi]RAT33420.1 phosphogluconate dehydratase [Lonsdalea populi]RAT62070.1 phosphogluconate dehydratase [Lonsdalea populi]